MIEMASPRDKEKVIPERIVSGPRGVVYSFVRLETSSNWRTYEPLIPRKYHWSGSYLRRNQNSVLVYTIVVVLALVVVGFWISRMRTTT